MRFFQQPGRQATLRELHDHERPGDFHWSLRLLEFQGLVRPQQEAGETCIWYYRNLALA